MYVISFQGNLIREFEPNTQICNSCHVSIATGILVLSPAPCQNRPDSRSRRSMLLQQKDAISHPRDFCPSFFSKKKPVPMILARRPDPAGQQRPGSRSSRRHGDSGSDIGRAATGSAGAYRLPSHWCPSYRFPGPWRHSGLVTLCPKLSIGHLRNNLAAPQ
jgi:hypothetical protein